MAILFWLN